MWNRNNLSSKTFFWIISMGIIIVLWSCQPRLPLANAVVNDSIESHGGMRYDTLQMSFDFRDKHYIIDKKSGQFSYSRQFSDTLGRSVTDILDNEGFVRLINDTIVDLTEKEQSAYSNALNSVIYFALLPHGLNDSAVNKTYISTQNLKGKMYHVIQVTFQEEGGGEDFEDEFLYWINTEDQFVDYLAYSYKVEGGGLRFRQAFNRRQINGLTVQDYYNFKPQSKDRGLFALKDQFDKGQLELLSKIELTNVKALPQAQ